MPDPKRIRHADVVFCQLKCLQVWLGWGEGGSLGVGQGAEHGCEMGQLILSMGPAWAEVCILAQKATTPSKRFISL